MTVAPDNEPSLRGVAKGGGRALKGLARVALLGKWRSLRVTEALRKVA